MSLAGIAISIGVLVDGAIVEVENAYNKIHHWMKDGRKGDFHQVRLEALLEVGPGVFFSLLVIAVAFMPVFTLVDQEGRLFRPLAYSKNLAMAIAAFLAITLDPAMRMMFARIDDVHASGRAGSPGSRTQALVGTLLLGGGAPDLAGSSTGSTSRPAGSCSATRRRRSPRACSLVLADDPGLPVARLRVHAAAPRGHDPLHAVGGASPACRSPRRRRRCRSRTRS